MRYLSVPREVKAFQVESRQRIKASDGDRDAEPGDWLVHFGKVIRVVKQAEFHSQFQTAAEIVASLSKTLRPGRASYARRSPLYDRVLSVLKGGRMSTRQVDAALEDVNSGTLRNLLRKGRSLKLWQCVDGYWQV